MPTVTAPRNTRTLLEWTHRKKRFLYALTPEDRLWWVRAIWREGAPQIAVGHTLLQRFAYLYSTGGPHRTLTAFLRAYCQPINPAWFPNGKLSKARVRRLLKQGDTEGAKTERERAKSRVVYASTPLAAIPARYREIAEQILSGATRSPVPDALHFTSSFATRGDSEAVAREKATSYAQSRNLKIVPIPEGFQPGVNWFFSTGKTPPSVSIGTIAIASAAPIGFLVAGGLWWLFRKRKKSRI